MVAGQEVPGVPVFKDHVGAFANQAGRADYLPVVDDPLVDPGAAESVHSKRVDRLTAKAGGAVAWGEELRIELHC